jgi:phosphoribosylaminoimidazolecarboxamide formyltransferase/IMP cyclohydrolase
VSVRRALLSVSDKTGIVELARALVASGVELVSSGGTAQALSEAGVPVTPVSDVTGAPEILGGRVKTLHPRIHGGILADRRDPTHSAELEAHGIEPFDLVVCNLYPFERTVERAGVTDAEAVEHIDIGGPVMVRAAAKNYGCVAVVVHPDRYALVAKEIESIGEVSEETRRTLAVEAFEHTAAYDTAIAAFFAADLPAQERRRPRGAAPRQGPLLQQPARRGCGMAARLRAGPDGGRHREALEPLRRRARRRAGACL